MQWPGVGNLAAGLTEHFFFQIGHTDFGFGNRAGGARVPGACYKKFAAGLMGAWVAVDRSLRIGPAGRINVTSCKETPGIKQYLPRRPPPL
jgi:hypothetical protein